MRQFQTIHAIITSLLLIAMLTVGTLTFLGVIEVRFPDKAQPNGRIDTATPKKAFRLLVVRGLKPNTEYPIYEGVNFIGRADEKPVDIDLEFQEPPERIWSSRQHAVIMCENGSLTIEDLNSSNGTYVNRKRVPPGQKRSLAVDDVIQIGEVQLKVLHS